MGIFFALLLALIVFSNLSVILAFVGYFFLVVGIIWLVTIPLGILFQPVSTSSTLIERIWKRFDLGVPY